MYFVFDKDDKHNLYICGKSLMYIIGSKIDYIEDLMGSRFDFQMIISPVNVDVEQVLILRCKIISINLN